MADKRIEELPILSTDDFNFSTDYVIVQQPGGGTYKMIAGQAFADINSGGVYVDYKNATLSNLNSATLEFNALNLLSENSAWKMDFVFRVSSIQILNGRTSSGINKGDMRLYSVIKSQDSTLIGENNIASSSSIEVASFQNRWAEKHDYFGNRNAGTATVYYTANIDTSRGIDQMTLSINPSFESQQNGQSPNSNSSVYPYYSDLAGVELSVSIFAHLKP